MKKILFLFLGLFLACGTLLPAGSDFVLVIDPGHGGKDPGAVRGKIKEKEINLAVALHLGKLIEKNHPDVKVVYTRKNDTFVALDRRSKIANQHKANLFISIHTNSTAAKATNATGADTYILGLARSAENLAVAKRENAVIKYEEDYTTKYEGFDPDSPESYIIFEFMTNHYMQQSLDVASYIQNAFKNNAKRVDRGVRQAGFLVLRESSMPSILIELGFINNAKEANYLNSKAGQQAMASAIYTGFKKYKDDFDKVQNGSTPPAKSKETPKQQQAIAQTETPSKDKSATITTDAIEYRIQIIYSPTQLKENSPKFKGLKDISFYIDNGYKYTVGSTTNYNEIKKKFAEVKKKFPDAFIIRMKNGKRI